MRRINFTTSFQKSLLLLPAFLLTAGSTMGYAQETAPSEAAPKPYEPAHRSWPPATTLTLTAPDFLKVPDAVKERMAAEGAAPFVMAKTPPTLELAYHSDIAISTNRTGWTIWGDIGAGADGRVYSGIGNHGRNDGDLSTDPGEAFIYSWDPATKRLHQIADLNQVAGAGEGDPRFSKVHAGVYEGPDGKIYYSGTLNDGGRSHSTKWTPRVPGGMLFSYDPKTGENKIVTTFTGEVTPTTLIDRRRNIWYANMEGKTKGGDIALTAVDLNTGKVIYQSPHDAVVASRNFFLANDGRMFFNGKGGIWVYNPDTKAISQTRSAFPGTSTMRASTRESRDGYIYGVTTRPGTIFRYSPARDELTMLGRDFLAGDYTTVAVLSPDDKYVYYLPGAHGGAVDIGTPVMQYNIATGERKVLAFLRDTLEQTIGYTPGGTYGVTISADGSTLFVNFNGAPADSTLVPFKHAKGFSLTSFAAIHIPASER